MGAGWVTAPSAPLSAVAGADPAPHPGAPVQDGVEANLHAKLLQPHQEIQPLASFSDHSENTSTHCCVFTHPAAGSHLHSSRLESAYFTNEVQVPKF